ncbi:MAG: hypothetical protein JWO52_7005 [Gammaproteobacteria bacterium]|jgi:hypothetical protein|nr:hypothetical protein [Gammaproteobacteria bacterium]
MRTMTASQSRYTAARLDSHPGGWLKGKWPRSGDWNIPLKIELQGEPHHHDFKKNQPQPAGKEETR